MCKPAPGTRCYCCWCKGGSSLPVSCALFFSFFLVLQRTAHFVMRPLASVAPWLLILEWFTWFQYSSDSKLWCPVPDRCASSMFYVPYFHYLPTSSWYYCYCYCSAGHLAAQCLRNEVLECDAPWFWKLEFLHFRDRQTTLRNARWAGNGIGVFSSGISLEH